MKCPLCNAPDTKVVDTRASEDDKTVRRRRGYISYHKRFATYERYGFNNLIVVKKDKNREALDRGKVYRGMEKSYEKRLIPDSVSLEAAKEVEVGLTHSNKREIDSPEISELIMKKPKKINKVAYTHFASVYKEFTDVRSFNKEVSKSNNE